MILDDEMIIKTDSGEEKVMKILFTYESEQRNKQYVFLYEEDDEEYAEAEEVFNAYMNDEKIQEIKN